MHIAPYFLRLNLPHNVLEDDASGAKYYPGSGYLTVTLTKENKGQDFPDLDMLARLLAPRPSQVVQPSIEVLSSQDDTNGDDQELVDQAEGLTLEDKELTTEQREILKGMHPSFPITISVRHVWF